MSFLSEAGRYIQMGDKLAHGVKVGGMELKNPTINKISTNISKFMDTPWGGAKVTEHLKAVEAGTEKYGVKDYARLGLQTYAGASIAGRVISGGGLYKDSNGNTDIVGIPFI